MPECSQEEEEEEKGDTKAKASSPPSSGGDTSILKGRREKEEGETPQWIVRKSGGGGGGGHNFRSASFFLFLPFESELSVLLAVVYLQGTGGGWRQRTHLRYVFFPSSLFLVRESRVRV